MLIFNSPKHFVAYYALPRLWVPRFTIEFAAVSGLFVVFTIAVLAVLAVLGVYDKFLGGFLVNSVNERDLSLLTSYVEIIAIVGLKRGIPSKRESSARVDYVPALCTHRPSLLPIEWSGEVLGSWRRGRFAAGDVARIPLNLII
ncbi:hypothetical protein SSX86_003893 [Deinandra increscens subsp. villosa]|uniref:Uncharacterized protein n=1 Tax=Deinandra increscens subsp. villosa TaxID=3103831 RepID=A0AAP0H5F6_9ASTR